MTTPNHKTGPLLELCETPRIDKPARRPGHSDNVQTHWRDSHRPQTALASKACDKLAPPIPHEQRRFGRYARREEFHNEILWRR
jgi:hypothetical protein